MASAPDDRSTLVYALETLGPLRTEIEEDAKATLKPDLTSGDDLGQQAIHSLMEAAQRERTVTLGDTLGQGGMGVVHLAEQVALGRTVAVKRLRPEHGSRAHVLSLMREAWVTGSLEHPNVVPIHDVGLDADGQPFLVMKRIEGEHWGRLIAEPDEVRRRFEVSDVVAWHLGVLQQVCHAVAFAHARGVLHRDLKPENVMVGAFGEVYLLDWGIAVSLEPDPSGRLPSVGRKGRIAGTPAYMAPEMLGAGELGTWSDVYLLGGLLYEILAGRPPHEGGDLEALLARISVSRPPAPEGPTELVELCLAALSPDPADRPASAEQFRQGVARHLEHRSLLRVVEEAESARERLEAILAGDTPDSDALWNLFGEARFGFRQVQRAWPEHEGAQAGLVATVEAMVRWELDQGDAPGAARLVAEDPVVTEALATEVKRAIRRAERAARDVDSQVGQRTRWFVAVVLALIWSAFPLGLWWLGKPADYDRTMKVDLIFVALVVGLGIWARDSLSKTALNRKTWAVLLSAPSLQITFALGAQRLGLDAPSTIPMHIFIWSVVAWLTVIALEWRFFPMALGYTVSWMVAATYPADAMLYAGLANLVLAANISVLWFPLGVPRSDVAPERG